MEPDSYLEYGLGLVLGILIGWLWEILLPLTGRQKPKSERVHAKSCPLHGHISLDALNAEVSRTQDSLAFIPTSTKEHVDVQAKLSDILLQRYRHSRDMRDLDAAISSMNLALSSADSAPPPVMLGKMGVLLNTRYEKIGDLSDLDNAIQHLKRAVGMFAVLGGEKMNPNLGILHGDLSIFYDHRYQRHGGDLGDLDARIEHAMEAARITAENDPYRVVLLHDLSAALVARYERLGNFVDLDAALDNTKAAIASTGGVIPKEVLLEDMSNYIELKYNRSNSQSDLEEAINSLRNSLSITPADHPARIARLANFSRLLFERYDIQPQTSDLDEAIQSTKEGLALLETTQSGDDSSFDLTRSNMLTNLSSFFQARYSQLQDASDLEAGIESGEAALKYIPRAHPERPGMLSNLALVLRQRYLHFKNPKDLEDAITYIKDASFEIPKNHPERPRILSNAGKLLNDRFEKDHEVVDLDEAITYGKAAVETSTSNSERGSKLDALAWLLFSHYRVTGAIESLEAAIKHIRAAINIDQPGSEKVHMDRCGRLNSMLFARYQARDSLDDLNAVIEHLQGQLALTPPPEPPIQMRLLNNLSGMLMARYERLNRPEDLDTVIANEKKVLELTPEGHPSRAELLASISFTLRRRNKRLDSPDDLASAVAFAKEAVEATPLDAPERAYRIGNLSAALHDRYDRLGDPDDLECAIELMKDSIRATAPGQQQHYLSLSNLSILLHCRYLRHGALSDLEAAIEHTRTAVDEVPKEQWQQKLNISKSLGTYLRARFNRLGTLKDLEEAISHIEAKLEATPSGHPSRADLLGDLSSCFESKYRQLGGLNDLETAIFHGEATLKEISAGYPLARSSRLRSLSARYHLRYEKLGDMEDLNKSIDTLKEALTLTPEDWPGRADMLIALGTDLRIKYKRLRRTPGGNEDDSTSTEILATLQQDAFQCFFDAWKCQTTTPLIRVQAVWRAVKFFDAVLSDEQSADLLEEAVNMLPSISLRWMDEGDQQRVLSQLYGLSSLAASYALKAGKGAFAALRILEFGRGVIIGYAIDQRSDVGVQGLKTTHPELAKRFHDLRKVINSPSASSAGVSSGNSNHDHCKDNCGGGEDHGEDHAKAVTELDALSRRKEAMAQFTRTLTEIREIPEYRNFLLPPTEGELMHIARHGAIVVMCSTALRSDAIIVTMSGIQALELPTLPYKETKTQMRKMGREYVKGPLRTFHDRNKNLNKLLLWLWDHAVEPVLSGPLRLDGTMNAGTVKDLSPPPLNFKLPRIWWIGIGELSMAPFHAAGDHRAGSTRNTMSRAVSSYIPSIKALAYSRQQPLQLRLGRNVIGEPPKILLVTMPATPGEAALPRVEEEIKAIVSVFETKAEPEEDVSDAKDVQISPIFFFFFPIQYSHRPVVGYGEPTAATVLSHLPNYDIAHFACHGVSDNANPFRSSLLLARPKPATPEAVDTSIIMRQPGATALEVDKLYALDISHIYTANSDALHAQLAIAYLSACCTADNPSIDLADETIHLASAFQLAGFSHVLATLWQGRDNACMMVAEEFYRSLFMGSHPATQIPDETEDKREDGDGGHGMVARAMHKAVWRVRDSMKAEKPLIWAPFVHTGA